MEVQQSPIYQQYITTFKWNVELYDHTAVFWRHIPLAGTIAKIQRATKVPDADGFIQFLSNRNVKTIAYEPDSIVKQKNLDIFGTKLSAAGFKINRTPFLPTKTVRVDLSRSEQEIYNSFSEAKRRAVRKAQKNNVSVGESNAIDDLIKIKNKSAGFLGFITTTGINKMWPIFTPEHATCVLAYDSNHRLLGGILLVFYDGIAYYWIAGTIKRGKKLFAPTLLVWEAIKISKARKCTQLDFVGVWDERFPTHNRDWLGFTKFKEGFGGEELYYPVMK